MTSPHPSPTTPVKQLISSSLEKDHNSNASNISIMRQVGCRVSLLLTTEHTQPKLRAWPGIKFDTRNVLPALDPIQKDGCDTDFHELLQITKRALETRDILLGCFMLRVTVQLLTMCLWPIAPAERASKKCIVKRLVDLLTNDLHLRLLLQDHPILANGEVDSHGRWAIFG